MDASAVKTQRLLREDEPTPCTVYNPQGKADLLLLCDHAENFIPQSLDSLGLTPEQLERHIAYDIGIAPVTRQLAEALDAPAVFSHFSRLIVDPNRQLDDPTLIPAVSDGTVVPGNRDLDAAAVESRLETFHRPYHATVARQLDAMQAEGRTPVLVSMHSFTPVMRGRERPWEIGILWNVDARLPLPMMEAFRERGYCVGDNEPYSGRDGHGYTSHVHGDGRGLANALVELRQDLIDTRRGQKTWAQEMLAAMRHVLQDPALYRTYSGG